LGGLYNSHLEETAGPGMTEKGGRPQEKGEKTKIKQSIGGL